MTRWGSKWIRGAARFLTRGRTHRRRLDDLDVRIVVMGTRGKSTLVEWLYEALVDRGYDTYAKVTGEKPRSLYGGRDHPIDRTGQTMLYENEREIRTYDPTDALVVENQGIREYTTRLVNDRYVDPTLVVLTNVRRDHLDTLGTDHRTVARALAQAIPSETHVISGERNEAIDSYLHRELTRRGSTLTRAWPDVEQGSIASPSRESIALVETVLDELGEPPLTPTERQTFRDELRIEWTRLETGRLYFAAGTNDVESTELIRRLLTAGESEPIQPLVYFRQDRPGRTDSYLEYLNGLAERDLVRQVHVVGDHLSTSRRRLSVPVVTHDERADESGEVLDEAIAEGLPVIVMGNAVPEFMQRLKAEIERRRQSVERESEPTTGESLAPTTHD